MEDFAWTCLRNCFILKLVSTTYKVKFFSSEDCPSKVGQQSKDHHRPKTLSTWPSTIKWKCPPMIALSDGWRVTTGEESKEKHDQELREKRELEAFYPRISSIPLGPYVSSAVEKECYDDSLTPLVPLSPIEEQDDSVENIKVDAAVTKHAESSTKELQSNLQQNIPPATSLVNSQCSEKPEAVPATSFLEADLVGASVAVASAIMKSNEQGNKIDVDLLLQIFSDPIMVAKIIEKYRNSSTIMSTPTFYSKPSTSSIPLSSTTPNTTVSLLPASEPSVATPSVSLLTSTTDNPATPPVSAQPAKTHFVTSPTPPSPPHMHRSVNKNISHMPNRVVPSLNTNPPKQEVKPDAPLASVFSTIMHGVEKQVGSTTAGAVKDVNFYKNLVRNHGTHRQDMQSHSNLQDLKRPRNNIIKPVEVKFQIQKPCRFFNRLKGCRNGSNCPYQHDMSGTVLTTHKAKRLKVVPKTTWKM
ncbi:Zinc finger CCCH domain-containing protein 68, partial [Mucuna pruriens]